jgi:hypothetical protein
LPVKIVVLNFIFTKGHLEAIIKLTIGICKENAPYKDYNQSFNISFFQGCHEVTGSVINKFCSKGSWSDSKTNDNLI